MNNPALKEMALGLRADWVTSATSAFRPATWPPARDWPVSVDRAGVILSRWGDPVWDLTPLAGTTFKLNFGDGADCRTEPLDSDNADLLRLAVTWRMWGPRSVRAAGTLQATFTMLRAVVALCSRNGILASDLMRFPRVFEQLPDVIAPSRFGSTITELHRIYDSRESLGFFIVDADGLKRLVGAQPDHETVQTPYIPPRIWSYQVQRLRECLDDFLGVSEQVEAFFHYCIEAYSSNYGSLVAALAKDRDSDRAPFNKNSRTRPGTVYLGTFSENADNHRVTSVLTKWLGVSRDDLTVRSFSAYLSLVNIAGVAYVANFTMQRKEEVASLRTSCLTWEEDERLGRVPIICGETTKTDNDSDARWVASPSVEVAVNAMAVIARMRMISDRANPVVAASKLDEEDPYLFANPSEPWGSGKVTVYHVRREVDSMAEVIRHYPALFDSDQLRITEADLRVARQLTPNLPGDKFAVGQIWPLAWHQYRRTSAVNMFASGLISDSSMQNQMKHSSRLMPLYYGRGYTRLHLNEQVEATVVAAMYESMAAQLRTAMSERFVSPHSDERKQAIVVNLVSTKDVKTLTAWARNGKVSFRENRLGGCMKSGACEYGGVESVARCAGGDGGKPCSDVLFDRAKEPQIRGDLKRIDDEIANLSEDSPRRRALLADRRGLENYLNVINTN